MNEQDILNMQYERQRDLQKEGIQEQQKQYVPQIKERMAEVQAAIIAQTNPAKSLKIILNGLEGKLYNEYGEYELIGYPTLNQEGIASISSMLIPFINDAIRFGNISETEVRKIANQMLDDVTEKIGLKWREYGIKDPSDKGIIIDTILALVFITLTRSEEQGEKNWLGKVVLESVSQNKPIQKRKESVWEKYLKL